MKKTNYQRIATCYDDNEFRHHVPEDYVLEQILAKSTASPFRLLDLACGTGIYLNVQYAAFAGRSIEWHGFDASDAMLAVARQKVPGVAYEQGTAEELPYADNFFDLVTSHFAFHHFPEKARSLHEIRRILRDGGHVKIFNVAPEDMEGWWLYAYFPKCREIDQERFWSYRRIYDQLESAEFNVTCTVTKTLTRFLLETAQREALRRDTSQLDVLDDDAYHEGLQRIEDDLEQGVEHIVNEMAFVEILGQKHT